MMLTRGHVIRLWPTQKQDQYFRQACGGARHAYNWALDEWQVQYAEGLRPSGFSLKKKYNSLKRTEFPWAYNVTKCAPEQSFADLQKAFKNFFAGRACYPKFKKKGIHDQFYLNNLSFTVQENRLKIPKLGWVKATESLRFSGKILSARVKRMADKWFISIAVETELPTGYHESQVVAGVDLGLNSFAYLSTGESFDAPKPLRKLESRLKTLQRRVSRKKKGSANRRKAIEALSRLHLRIRWKRQDFLHKLSTYLVRSFSCIVIEDLNVKGMLRNHCLAKSISDIGWSEFRRQLEYKALQYGTEIVVADRWFPSTKTCHNCGVVREAVGLHEREFRCPECGFTCNRDLNAALNLSTLGPWGSNACGQNDRCTPALAGM